MPTFENLKTSAIPQVLSFLPFFEDEAETFYTENNTSFFHPYSYHEQVENFLGAVYDAKLIQAFEWRAWKEEAQQYYDQPERLEEADLDILIRLFTYHIRRERFYSGHLVDLLDNGYFMAMLRRLQELT
ncbi:MAG: DUF6508 domain-containing protein [Bacteroidota bacterium]